MSTLTVTTINTANGTTDLTITSGNTSSGRILISSGAGVSIASNSTVNAIVISATGNVGIGNSSPVAELHIDGNYAVRSTTLSAGNNHNINCASGNYFVVVANSSAQNVYFTSVPSSVAYSMVLRFSNGAGGNTLSWANTPRWPSATAPTPSTNNDVYVFFTDDGGTNWRGIQSQKDSR
jgi:hypothetical protein